MTSRALLPTTFLLFAAALARPAAAQSTTSLPNSFAASPELQFLRPTAADGGVINCVVGQAGQANNCLPFNRALCTDDGANHDIALSVIHTDRFPLVASNNNIHSVAWIQGTGTRCSYGSSSMDPNKVFLLGISPGLVPTSSVFLGGTLAFDFPSSAAGRNGLTMRDVMNAFPNVCDPNGGVALTQYQICFGADVNQDTIVGPPVSNSFQDTDPISYFEFAVDTIPPPAITLASVESLVSRVRVVAEYDAGGGDVAYIDVLSAKATDAVLAEPDCTKWPAVTTTSHDIRYNLTGSESVEVPGENGVEYAYCVRARDYLFNEGPTSPVHTASPHVECDLIGCYPADLDVGYCGAGLGSAAAAGGLVALARAWRRRRAARR